MKSNREVELTKCLEEIVKVLKSGRVITVLVDPMPILSGVLLDKLLCNMLIDDIQRTLGGK